jgi:hypothetical protein
MRLAALLQIALVIFLPAPEGRRRLNLCHYWPGKPTALAQFFFRHLRRGLLFGRMIKDDGAILRSDVRTLAVQCHRVVVRPKNLEELFVADLRRIEFDFNDFSVACFVRADIFVAGIFFRPAGVTDGSSGHAFQSTKRFLHAPETACPKGRLFHCHSRRSNGREPGATTTQLPLAFGQRATRMSM